MSEKRCYSLEKDFNQIKKESEEYFYAEGHPCYYPKCTQKEKTVKSHSISEGRHLSLVAEHSKVYYYNFKNIIPILKQTKCEPIKSVISEVSWFRGFCKTHDNNLFEVLDNYAFNKTDKQSFLNSYRALCFEETFLESLLFFYQNSILSRIYKAKNELENGDLQSKMSLTNNNEVQECIMRIEYQIEKMENAKDRIPIHIKLISEYRIILDEYLLSESYDALKYKYLEFNKPVCCTGVLINTEMDKVDAIFSSLPFDGKYILIFSYLEENESLKKLFDRLSDDNEILKFIFSVSKNYAIKPSFWDNDLPQKQQKYFIEIMNGIKQVNFP